MARSLNVLSCSWELKYEHFVSLRTWGLTGESIPALKDCIIQRTLFAQTWGLFIVDFGLNVNMSTYINFQGRVKLPRDAELSFNRLRLFPGKKGNVINRNFSPIIYKKSKNQLTHSLPEKWLKLRLNFPFERQKQIAINKVNNCLLEDSAAVQIR